MESNREYKDSVFRMYFNDEKKLKDLYRAITGEECEEIHSVEIATLKDSIYGNIKNDISFIVNGKLFIFTEHMSTKSPNMPIRLLEYATSSLNIFIDHTKVYSSELQMFPAPEFYVLYNGKRSLREDEKILRLSDSFLGTPDSDCSMELIVKVIDINIDSVDEPVHTCRYLNEYATFIGKIRENRAGGMELDQAIDEAIVYCIENEIMVEFLQEYGQKVRSMIFTRLTDEEMRDILVESEVKIQVKEQVEEALKNLTDKVTQEVTDKVTQEVTDKVTQEVTDKVTQEVTDKVTQEVTDKVTSEVTDKVTSEVTDKVTSEVTDKITNADIIKLVSVMKELGTDKDVAISKLIEKYGLSEDKASDIIERNW